MENNISEISDILNLRIKNDDYIKIDFREFF